MQIETWKLWAVFEGSRWYSSKVMSNSTLRLLWFLHFACKLQTEWTVYSLINIRAHYFLQYKYNLDKRMGSYNKDYTFSYFSGKWYCAVFLVSCEDLVSLKVIFSRGQKNSLIRKGFK